VGIDLGRLTNGPAFAVLADADPWTLTPATGGDEIECPVIFREEEEDVRIAPGETGADVVTATGPLATVRLSELGGIIPDKDDRIAGRGRAFLVRKVHLPGDGTADLWLFEAETA
jgi:hypothetical protein